MTSISPKQKERLQNALDRITDECTNGSDPNDAIIKVAKDLDLHEDELPLLVRGYNVGATNAQWKSSKDQQIKLAEFPIADIAIINSRLYPNQVKTASVRKQKTDNTFLKSASSIFDGCFKKEYNYDALPMTKSAEKHSREDDAKAFFAKEDAILQQIHHIQDAYMLKKYAAKKDFDEKVEAFADCLQDPYAPELEQMKKQAQSIHGDSGELLIRYTLERFPAIANRPRVIKSAEALSVDSKFYKTMDSALKALDLVIKTDLQEKQACAKCASALEPIAKGRKEAVYGDEMDQALLSPEEVYDNQMKKEAGDLIPSLDDYIHRTSGPSWEHADPTERAVLKELADRSPLRNQKVRALLLDLASSDPYLRQQDPDVIAAAFNDLYEANPVDALKRIWLKTQLPQYIASENLDAPTVSSMIESGRSARKDETDRIKSLFDQFMNTVSLNEKKENQKREEDRDKYQKDRDVKLDKRYEDEDQYRKDRDKIMDTRYTNEDTYRKNRDTVMDTRYTAEDTYRKGRDKIMDNRYAAEDAYKKKQDADREKYQKDRDKIMDNRYAAEDTYKKSRDTKKDSEEQARRKTDSRRKADDLKIRQWEYNDRNFNKAIENLAGTIKNNRTKTPNSTATDYLRNVLKVPSTHPIYGTPGIDHYADTTVVDKLLQAYQNKENFRIKNPDPYQTLIDDYTNNP